MGTNFYTKDGVHIGKRSAAGAYCWDCKLTLCPGGEDGVHDSQYEEWLDECPNCGLKKQAIESLDGSSVGRELGFNKTQPEAKKGVASCSSFSWAIKPNRLRAEIVVDEYDREFSSEEFKEILAECPIQYYHNIGHDFC